MARILNLIVVLIMSTGLFLSACNNEGPAEKAGKKIDKTMEKAGDALKDAADNAKE